MQWCPPAPPFGRKGHWETYPEGSCWRRSTFGSPKAAQLGRHRERWGGNGRRLAAAGGAYLGGLERWAPSPPASCVVAGAVVGYARDTELGRAFLVSGYKIRCCRDPSSRQLRWFVGVYVCEITLYLSSCIQPEWAMAVSGFPPPLPPPLSCPQTHIPPPKQGPIVRTGHPNLLLPNGLRVCLRISGGLDFLGDSDTGKGEGRCILYRPPLSTTQRREPSKPVAPV